VTEDQSNSHFVRAGGRACVSLNAKKLLKIELTDIKIIILKHCNAENR